MGIPFTGSCEFEISKVKCWLGEKYSNEFELEIIAKDVKVRKLVWVKSKYELEKINKFYTTIKMVTLKDLETYFVVKDYKEENNINIKELLESMNCKKVPITVTCDGVKKKFYSIAFAARYMGVPLPTVYYAHSKRSETIVRRKGGVKVFFLDWNE